MTVPPSPDSGKRTVFRRFLISVLAGGTLLGAVLLGLALRSRTQALPPPPVVGTESALVFPFPIVSEPHLTLWWDTLPLNVRDRVVPSGSPSNIHPADYVGPQACARCHARNYEMWSHHPHRWMNALADEMTVKGDFSGRSVSYRGEQLTFFREGSGYRMRIEGAGGRRTYEVTQTIGSRFFQYYAGKLVEGPEPKGHPFYTRDHVLPFGYWLEPREWVPVVHIGPEVPDGERPDPLAPPDHGRYYADYAVGCNACHTTFPLADMFSRRTHQMGERAPWPLHWSLRPYLQEAHPEVLPVVTRFLRGDVPATPLPTATRRSTAEDPGRGTAGDDVPTPMADWEAPRYAVTLGVSCEACHLGGRAHVESEGRVPPGFFPASPYLSVETGGPSAESGRTRANVNWICGRCHIGSRPQFAAGMSTWNSVEYADAMRGSCYSQLRCIDCHNPHRALGPKWSRSGDQDDARCLKCHEQFQRAPQRLAHTHHPAGSEGARCMNCHMPRINEGLQDVVRTHMIYSPTRADMIEANHPNACNLCHTDRPIDWTLGYLKTWYGSTYDDRKIAANYPHRDQPAALGWLKSRNPAVRLVAVEALTRARDVRALPQLLDALDDPYLVNRQFALKGLQQMLHVRPGDFGYRFTMTEEERRKPLALLRATLCPGFPDGPSRGGQGTR